MWTFCSNNINCPATRLLHKAIRQSGAGRALRRQQTRMISGLVAGLDKINPSAAYMSRKKNALAHSSPGRSKLHAGGGALRPVRRGWFVGEDLCLPDPIVAFDPAVKPVEHIVDPFNFFRPPFGNLPEIVNPDAG